MNSSLLPPLYILCSVSISGKWGIRVIYTTVFLYLCSKQTSFWWWHEEFELVVFVLQFIPQIFSLQIWRSFGYWQQFLCNPLRNRTCHLWAANMKFAMVGQVIIFLKNIDFPSFCSTYLLFKIELDKILLYAILVYQEMFLVYQKLFWYRGELLYHYLSYIVCDTYNRITT